ncbi:hypothetical protein [Calycomorphotria hydatis]|uniref:Uncharacterized protein n=1 Tax=Calycomorphotria hydatis TaxID=2528027 RepID=A0A517T4C3_9PLAN|nr:hypothetical protein [Calycomorphotria hydatis]QDT63226.1 hypothetical protein V22_04450 [Calycomorphotria hydatis]
MSQPVTHPVQKYWRLCLAYFAMGAVVSLAMQFVPWDGAYEFFRPWCEYLVYLTLVLYWFRGWVNHWWLRYFAGVFLGTAVFGFGATLLVGPTLQSFPGNRPEEIPEWLFVCFLVILFSKAIWVAIVLRTVRDESHRNKQQLFRRIRFVGIAMLIFATFSGLNVIVLSLAVFTPGALNLPALTFPGIEHVVWAAFHCTRGLQVAPLGLLLGAYRSGEFDEGVRAKR